MASRERYLVLTDAAQVSAAAEVVGDIYKVISREDALNGHAAEIAEFPIVLWPTPEHVIRERHWASELAAFSPEVKLINTALGKDMPPSIMAQIGWRMPDLLAWLTGKQDEHERIELVTANLATINEAPRLSGPPFGDSVAGSPSLSGAYADGASPLSEETGDWTTLEPPPSDDHPGLAGRAYVSHETAAGKPDEWPEPLDLGQSLHRGLPLPLELVPDALRPLILDCTKRTGIDPAPYFFGFLGAISGLCNDFIRLQPKQLDTTWTVRGVVWPVGIGGPSSGKTPGIEEGMKILQKKDTEAVIENIQKTKDHKHLLDIYADECAVARKNKAPRPPEPPEPVLREYWVQRGTTEGVTRVLEHSSKVTWYMDEFSGLVAGWDAYKAAKGSGDREFVLMLWNGGPGKNTLAGKTALIRNASAVLCGGSTPNNMLSCAGGKLKNDGFLQRTLLCMVPDKGRGTDAAPDAKAYAAYERILDGIMAMPGQMILRMSTDASLIYNEFCDKIAARIQSEESESMKFHLGKWEGLAPRMMLLYYLIECAQHGQYVSDGAQIPAKIAQQVCRLLLEWQLSHLQQFWLELMADKAGRKFSQTISRYILANEHLMELNFRDHIARPHWRELDALKPWEVKEGINSLINAAWITPLGTKLNSYGVALNFAVNPKIPGLFMAQRSEELQMRAIRREELQAQRMHGREISND